MLVIFAGFIVLTLSNFVPLIQFGGLVSFCMIVTAFGVLVLVPAIIRVLALRDRGFLYLGTSEKPSLASAPTTVPAAE